MREINDILDTGTQSYTKNGEHFAKNAKKMKKEVAHLEK